MPKNSDSSRQSKNSGKPSSSKFSINADHVDSVTQAEQIENLTQNFGDTYNAAVKGSGAAAQGPGSTAAGENGMAISGDVSGSAIIAGDGNTVNIDQQHGGIRAGQIHAGNMVDGVQVQGVSQQNLPADLGNVTTGGIEADTIYADNVVSGLQAIDRQTGTGNNNFWRLFHVFIHHLQSAMDDGIINTPGDLEDIKTDLAAMQSETAKNHPDMNRIGRKLQSLSMVLNSIVSSKAETDERLNQLKGQVGGLLNLIARH